MQPYGFGIPCEPERAKKGEDELDADVRPVGAAARRRRENMCESRHADPAPAEPRVIYVLLVAPSYQWVVSNDVIILRIIASRVLYPKRRLRK
jgi:hypothetical protein